jgi:hypothetical protein
MTEEIDMPMDGGWERQESKTEEEEVSPVSLESCLLCCSFHARRGGSEIVSLSQWSCPAASVVHSGCLFGGAPAGHGQCKAG